MEILAVNPRKKKRAAPKKRGTTKPRKNAKTKPTKRSPTMPKKKRKKRRAAPKTRTRTRTKTVVRYRTRRASKKRRRNPSGRAYAKQTLLGVNIPGAVKDALPMLLGALAGKAAAKKFALGGGEGDNWSWANYLWCLGGSLIAAFGTQAIFKGKRGTAQKVFTGGMVLAAYKFFTNDIAPRNATLESWFGQDAEEARLIESASRAIDPYSGMFGDVTEQPEGDFQMLGRGYDPSMGQYIEPATPQMGQYIEPATARMGGVTDMFEKAYE